MSDIYIYILQEGFNYVHITKTPRAHNELNLTSDICLVSRQIMKHRFVTLYDN